MSCIRKLIKNESAGAMVENVIVLPLVFVVIIFMIMSAFMIHDRSTIESAARRGAIYAAHCLSDPNYATLLGQTGELDTVKKVETFNFSSVGKNIKAYRYINGGNNVESVVKTEVEKIVAKTRIPWNQQDSIKVTCKQSNKIIYQDVVITVKAVYSLPAWFQWFGLETQYTVSTEAKISAVDPDEFIRNADLVVDLITKVDKATGGYIEKALDSIAALGNKITKWISME